MFSLSASKLEAARYFIRALDVAAIEGRGAVEHVGAPIDQASSHLADPVIGGAGDLVE